MTLYATQWIITSDITPEWAIRVPQGGANEWLLSWVHDRLLTRAQAVVGMELDELLSDPDGVYDCCFLSKVYDCADRLGIPPEKVVVLLAARIVGRLQELDSVESRVQHLSDNA
ncbi:hypothetical protein ABZ942_01695 [Nocardia sp. NPDC046473]|uniref:hypothetical protein n=1 Tax=Nocardia sp. NPDC046473 TaxID=3155733 RepID=UPI0033DE0DA6